MGSTGVLKTLMYVLNVILTILGLGVAAVSIWFFVEVLQFTSLRNQNHYLLDYNVYWPQVIPWLFFFVAIFVLGVSCSGCASAKKKRTGLLKGYIGFVAVVIVLLAVVAIIASLLACNKSTDDFVKDTVWDAYAQSKIDHDVELSFNNIEKKLQCCGSDGPRDYRTWKDRFPDSCCDTYYHGWLNNYPIICEISNKLANERHGCATVAVQYARVIIYVLAALSIFTALVGVISIVVAVALLKALRRKRRTPSTTQVEFETKKVLL